MKNHNFNIEQEQLELNTKKVLKNGTAATNGIEKISSGKEINFISSPEKPLVAIYQAERSKEKCLSGLFGFQLECLGKPQTDADSENLNKQAIEFHQNIINAFGDMEAFPDTEFSIRFITDPKIKTFRIEFTVNTKASCYKALNKKLEHLIFITSVYFRQKNENNQPYIFSPISKEIDLKRIIKNEYVL